MAKPTLTDGVDTVTLNINIPLNEIEKINMNVFDIPTRAGNVLQFLGRGSTRIPMSGETNSQDDKNQLKTWSRAGTSLTYNDDENSNISVRVINFNNERRPGIPGRYYYSFEIIEDE